MCLTLCRLLFQEEGSGFLSACLSVGLLLSIRLQTHASVNVQPVGWEVRRAGDKPLPVFGCRAALHHPHQAQHLQEQLELGRYELRAPLGTSVPAGTFLNVSANPHFVTSAEGIGEGVEREDCVQALSGQIFMGMVSSQFQARLDTVRLIDALVTACIRFVYFSMEDELRSKVNTK